MIEVRIPKEFLIRVPLIYVIKNNINDKIYIGSTKSFNKRLSAYLSSLKTGKGLIKQPKLFKAFLKYGIENFYFELIELVEDKESLIRREQHYLDSLLCASELNKKFNYKGYNLCRIAGSPSRRTVTASEKAEMSRRNKGKILSSETRAKMSASRKGRKMSDEAKIKMSKAKKGSKLNLSEEQRIKLSQRTKGTKRPHSEETKIKLSKSKMGKKLDPLKVPRGSQMGNSVLNEDLVRKIKFDFKNGERLCNVARKYEINMHTVAAVKEGRSWNHVII